MKRIRLRDVQPRVRLRLHAQPEINILDAINDEFAPWFKDRDSWSAWFVFLRALFALPMNDQHLETYRKHTGRTDPPDEVAKEAWLICGRRAGKSFTLAVVAVFLACFHSYKHYLVPGERGVVLVIARDRDQAKVIFSYIRALLTHVPVLNRMLDGPGTKENINLTNDVSIQVATASFKSVRGRTTVAALIDELAYFPTDEAADPDVELLAAIRPSMLTIPNSMLLVASSPYARRGEVYNTYREHFGKDGPVLVWKATTREMNPLVPQSEIDAALEKDPARYAAEYLAEFRTDVEALFSREVVEECVAPGVRERPYVSTNRYVAFVDPSGGASDSFTLAIGHKEGDGAVLDAIRERKPPFSPESVVEEFCALMKSYRISRVIGDRYGGEWPRERFLKHGVHYEVSKRPKSDLYQAFVPLVLGKRADLLDHDRLITQLIGLERRTARGGRDSIDHSPGGHDDIANVVAGALTNLIQGRFNYDVELKNVMSRPEEKQSRSVEMLASLERTMTSRFW